MSSTRYKKLLMNLPSMAAIVNSFQSPDVQMLVYTSLMDALDSKESSGESKTLKRSSSAILANGEVAHELVEGDSIHSIGTDGDDE